MGYVFWITVRQEQDFSPCPSDGMDTSSHESNLIRRTQRHSLLTIKSRHIATLGVAFLLVAVCTWPGTSRSEFTSALDNGEPTSQEIDHVFQTYPHCGVLILYAAVASEHPALLSENLETASRMAGVFTASDSDYDDMAETLRVIAVHLSEHSDHQRSEAVAYWRRTCDNVERCVNEGKMPKACDKAYSALDNFDYQGTP
jgi:hypothetical protein